MIYSETAMKHALMIALKSRNMFLLIHYFSVPDTDVIVGTNLMYQSESKSIQDIYKIKMFQILAVAHQLNAIKFVLYLA